MLTKEAGEKIVMQSFFNEMEKNAEVISSILKGLSRLGEALKNFKFGAKWKSYADEALNVYNTSGRKGLWNHLESYRTPEFYKSKTSKVIRQEVLPEHENAGFLQREVGNTIGAFKRIGKGIKSDDGFFKGVGKMGKNLGNSVIDDFRSSRYKTVKPGERNLFGKGWTNKQVIGANGKKYIETSPLLGKRRIVGYTKNGDAIIRKRLPMQGMAMAMTPAGFAATGLLMGDSAYDSTKDFFKYKLFPGPAIATDLGGMAINAAT